MATRTPIVYGKEDEIPESDCSQQLSPLDLDLQKFREAQMMGGDEGTEEYFEGGVFEELHKEVNEKKEQKVLRHLNSLFL
jgi:hypothetical protein